MNNLEEALRKGIATEVLAARLTFAKVRHECYFVSVREYILKHEGTKSVCPVQ